MALASETLRYSRHAVIGVAALLVPVACSVTGYQAPPVSPAMMSHSRATAAVLGRGFSVHQAKCGKCHPLEDPANYSPEELRYDVMPTMARKSKLDAADAQAVLEYLLAARQVPPPPKNP